MFSELQKTKNINKLQNNTNKSNVTTKQKKNGKHGRRQSIFSMLEDNEFTSNLNLPEPSPRYSISFSGKILIYLQVFRDFVEKLSTEMTFNVNELSHQIKTMSIYFHLGKYFVSF